MSDTEHLLGNIVGIPRSDTGKVTRYQASCRCGWQGSVQPSRSEAKRAWYFHWKATRRTA